MPAAPPPPPGRPEPPAHRRRRAATGWDLATAAVIVALVGAHLTWIQRDRALPLWDEAQYLLESVRLHQALTDGGPVELYEGFSRSMGNKAPLIALLPLPSYALLGTSTEAARGVTVILLALALWWIYLVGSRMSGPVAGLLGAAFFGTFPLVAGLSRLLMVEVLLTLLVVLWVHALLRWREGAERSASWAMGAFLGLGLLAKVTFPLYVAAPTLVVFGRDVVEHRRVRPALWAALGRIAALGVPLAALWYARNWRTILEFLAEASFGRLARDYAKDSGDYWKGVADLGIGAPAVLLAAVLAGVMALLALRGRPLPRRTSLEHRLLLLGWALLPAVVLGSAVSKDVRFTIPYLPALALALGAGWASVATGRARLLLAAALAGASLLHFAWYSFVPVPPAPAVKFAGLHLPTMSGTWTRPPARERWPGVEVVAAVADDSRELGLERPSVSVLFSHPSLNAHNLHYLATRAGSRAGFRTYHFQAQETPEALARYTLEQVDYVVSKSGLPGGDRLNHVNQAVHARLVEAGFPFASIAVYPLPDQTTLTVWRSRRLGPPAALGEALDRGPQSARFAGSLALDAARLACENGTCRLALAWQATAPVPEDYRVFVHLWEPSGEIAAIADYDPGRGGRPTSRWRVGEVVDDTVTLPSLDGGRRLFVGWYRPEPRWRLPLSGAEAAWGGEPNSLELRIPP